MNFVTEGASHFRLVLPEAFTQPGARLLAYHCMKVTYNTGIELRAAVIRHLFHFLLGIHGERGSVHYRNFFVACNRNRS